MAYSADIPTAQRESLMHQLLLSEGEDGSLIKSGADDSAARAAAGSSWGRGAGGAAGGAVSAFFNPGRYAGYVANIIG